MDGDLELIAGSGGSIEVIDIKEMGIFSNYWSTYRSNDKRNGLFIYEADLSLWEEAVIPTKFKINSAYPNPFNPIINIQYQTPFHSHITMKVLDIRGRLVTHLVNKPHSPGFMIFFGMQVDIPLEFTFYNIFSRVTIYLHHRDFKLKR